MNSYTPTIGIEVHAELKTKSKMFCGSKNAPHESAPNTHVCPVCMAHPGTLPVINKEAVKHVLKVGLAINGSLADFTEFDRKNYFYPDIPKGYQISQYKYPLVSGGLLGGVAITRVHLEEDTARSLHDQGDGSIVDYNRAGVPLMELVTEPVIHDAKSAGDFARELQLLLRTLGVSDANMERGEMRVEANISISKTDELGTKVEVKNLNSFKAVEGAVAFEIKRQAEVLDAGEKVLQETRGWDDSKGKTFLQRSKETAEDYRYFPDPDLPKLNLKEIAEFTEEKLRSELPELPDFKRSKYSFLGIPREQVEFIVSDLAIAGFFDALLITTSDAQVLKVLANYLTSDMLSLMSERNLLISDAHTQTFVQLGKMIIEGKITSRVAKDLLFEVVFESKDPNILAHDRGLIQVNDEAAVRSTVMLIIAENPTVVAEFKSGKESSIQFLVGQGMKMTKGSVNPTVLKELLISEIGKI